MPAPFYAAIKGTTAGTPGTGAFTPNAASTGYRAWSNVAAGVYLVRYEDGSAWEISYSYWNATTLSRSSTQFFDSSTGSPLSLTSAATAAFVIDPAEVMSHVGTTPYCLSAIGNNTTAISNTGRAALTVLGTAAAVNLATTNFLTEQRREQLTSATTANAQVGWVSTTPEAVVNTTAGRGGGEFVSRFGPSALPTGPRLFAGMTTVTFNGSTAEPSALAANIVAFAKDSTDTNIQFLTRDGSTASKTDTGIPLAVNGWYETTVWWEPGSNKMWGLLIRGDTGDIWLGSKTTNAPLTGSLMFPQLIGGLNGTNTGTAMVLHVNGITTRQGF